MIYIVLGLIGAVTGSVYLYGRGDFLLGGFVGLLVAAVINQRNRLLALENRLVSLEKRIAGTFSAEGVAGPAEPSGQPESVRSAPMDTGGDDDAALSETEPARDAGGRAPTVPPPRSDPAGAMPSLELELSDDAIAGLDPPSGPPRPDPATPRPGDPGDRIRAFFLGGNLMVRVGVVVLLFGFAFLVKYAAARNLVPLEIRLAAAFAAGIGLLVLGWRLRRRRFGYAVTLQGGGIGVMYLTLFAAARLFHMVPLPLTFGVMVGLVAFSGVLAVLQNAAAMAVLGAAGGFMAPVLLSTGTGSHVMLFSYYALLNAGIFGIAWFKSWRWLNLLGFVFTFGIGSAWGLQYYRPHYFSTTEPFLVLFFLFYLAIAVLFALRQPPLLKGYVDSTLVFGMPLVVFALQVGLVKNFQYGLAFSAVAMGLVYTGLATALWRRRDDGLGALVEAFLALGVIFGSLAIPLALSGSWTAVAWSMEGAGLVWVGVRQRRWTARGFGLLLQVGSGAMFLLGSHGAWTETAVFNSRFLGGMMVGLSGLVSAFFLERYRDRLHRLERPFGAAIMAWGLLWWFGTGLDEIDRRMSRRHEWIGALAYIGLNGLAMGVLFRRLDWKGMRWPAMGLFPAMVIAAAAVADRHDIVHPFQGWWMAAWPLTFAIHLYLLHCMDTVWPRTLATGWHVAGALLATGLVGWEAGWLVDQLVAGTRVWPFIAWGIVPAGAVTVLIRLRDRAGWPFGPWENAYRGWLPSLLVLGLLAWTAAGAAIDGNPRPLPYLPLLNPLDVVQMAVFLVVGRWLLWMRREPASPAAGLSPVVLWGAPAAGVFLWLTAVVARTVHHLAGVRYQAEAMFRSDLFHAAIAVLWGLLAFGCMVASSRLRNRTVWFVGAGLLAVVVAKLFVVDLSGSGTVSRIVSFLAVGGLMLVVGFFTPLPPAESKGEGT
ncbi:membrane protein [Desulfosarcina alkanivorans]|uniref:Membrane protein n=1 Tax=Desulfosarcina alkanivorans TaxID=571177 RepID=A0A5K7YLW4_9BACT|nr:DUF2339 domain-containing protein [Desulfosarcina alkanivorans]BBO67831.1 membrane protein [Desulfosarcina alkanivorans]